MKKSNGANTPISKGTLDKNRNRNKNDDRNEAIDFAQDILNNKEKYIILDTETTGVGETDVIIQIGIIDLNENILLDTLIKPTKRKRMSKGATDVHNITMSMLKKSPSFKNVFDQFIEITKDKIILIYNKDFDSRLLLQTIDQDEIKTTANLSILDVMIPYSVFVGNWNSYHNDYKWQKLPGANHSAIEDCKSVIFVLNKMSKAIKK